jgi:hypothetical protein
MIPFPIIPTAMLEVHGLIEPCPEVRDWARAMFVQLGGQLYNADHAHLDGASVEFLWTNEPYLKPFGVRVLGTAELGRPAGTAWVKARKREQLHRWFGHEPDFIITLDVVNLSTARPEVICAIVEHELYHCAQETDEHGDLRYNAEGDPVWGMRPHCVEQFVGVTARYGAINEHEEALATAIRNGPTVGSAELSGVCGTCR